MATQLQIRRGTSAQVAAFTGAEGEVVVNTTNDSIHVNDGSTAGGFELARVDGSNWAITNAISTTANISFGDNDKAIFGAGSDLQLYHSGSHSYIIDNGTGDLKIYGANIEIGNASGVKNLFATSGGATTLYFNNAAKLATTSTGIDVTGTATMDELTVDSTTGFSWLPVSTAGAKVGAIGTGTGLIINTPSVNASFGSGLAIDGSYASDLSSVNVKAFGPKFSSYGSELNLFTSDDTSLLKRQTIASNGDISFYNSSGTSQSLFWDASAESLGIGTSSPSAKLTSSGVTGTTLIQAVGVDSNGFADVEIKSTGTAGASRLYFSDTAAQSGFIKYSHSDNSMQFATAAAERLRIDSSGNVGISSSSPSSYHAPADNLVIGSTGDNGLTIASGTSSGGTICFADGTSGGAQYAGFIDYQHNGDYMRFGTNLGVERLRIDSSGNVEVKGGQELRVYRGDNATYGSMKYLTGSGGLQLNDKNGDGISFVKADGATEYGRFDASGNLLVNRTSVFTTAKMEIQSDAGDASTLALNSINTDGSILEFYKAGNAVGSIGSVTQSGATNLVLDSTSAVYFDTNARPKTDNTYDVGSGTYRFKDLYLSGGVYLGGTGSANKLEDYEEGTWTPTLSGSTTNPTPTAVTVTNANYTKIGNTVFIRAYINVNLSNVGSGAAQIEGLPFAVKVGTYAPALFTHGSLIHSSGGYFASGATRIVAIDDNSVAGTPFAGTGTVRYLMITGQYETA